VPAGVTDQPSARTRALFERFQAFVARDIYPNEQEYRDEVQRDGRWEVVPLMEDLKRKAKAEGLWNLFLPDPGLGQGLSLVEYLPFCEVMGRVSWMPEVFNCSQPDTGNIALLLQYGTPAQKARWLEPLLAGEIRSCFAMTEPDVASSDATNIRTRITRDGSDYVIEGRKWWCTNAAHPRCRVAIVLGKTDPSAPTHQQQSMILVPIDAPGVRVERTLTMFGYDNAPGGHAEVRFENVRVPAENILLGEGRGFEIAQSRLGPGRVHHCMRLIGMAERALEAMCRRVQQRTAFGRPLAEQGTIRADIAASRMEIEQARLLVQKTAHLLDTVGAKEARGEIAMIKVVVPNMASRVIDRSIQAHGAAGLSQDSTLAHDWVRARGLRFADGPDEVHIRTVAKLELARHGGGDPSAEGTRA
jgi:acyl-CoA dehydrogenase